MLSLPYLFAYVFEDYCCSNSLASAHGWRLRIRLRPGRSPKPNERFSLPAAQVRKYVRYQHEHGVAFGRLEGETVLELSGDPLGESVPTGVARPLTTIRLLAPCVPSKVIAVGRNYRSHLGDRPAPETPALFAKFSSSIIGDGASIVLPPDALSVHYEGELVVVIGKKARNVPIEDAGAHVFGVTAGNDVSERTWQRDDLQWLRAKATDTFAPLGPAIVQGLNHNDLLLQTRLNGELRQSERTRHTLFNVETLVSYASRYFTLLPGDLIFTGTPGTTAAMKPGDVVEVEIEGVGTLRNPVAASQAPDRAYENGCGKRNN